MQNRVAEIEIGVGAMLDAASCPRKPVWSGDYTGKLQPRTPATPGVRGSARYSLCQCLAIRCCRLMHTKFKVAPVDMSAFVSRLWPMAVADLEAEFTKGNTAWLVINRKPGDEFVRPEAVGDVDRVLKEHGITAEVSAVSLQREWARVLERILPKTTATAEVN
jgi:hypothetical protein